MKLEEIPSIEEFEEINSLILDDEIKPIYELVDKNKPEADRFPTGFKIFDDVMDKGLKEGDLVVISGESGCGKTSFCQTLTYNLCKKVIPCLWFEYEINIEELHKRFEQMGLKPEDDYLAYAPKKNTTGNLSWLKYKIKESWIKYGCKIIFIDHIDYLTPSNARDNDSLTIAYKKIATELKSLAIGLNVVIVIMAHLKKIPDGKEPEMSDIGWSAGIFQLADYVFMIMRAEKNNKFGEKMGSGDLSSDKRIVKIVKNRQTGYLKFITCHYKNYLYLQEDAIRQPETIY